MGGDRWWCKAQETWSDELVFFSWAGYPRWPGIVLKPIPEAELLRGEGYYYKPEKKLFRETWTEVRQAPLRVGHKYDIFCHGSWRPGKVTYANMDGTFDAVCAGSGSDIDVEYISRGSIRERGKEIGVRKRQTRAAGQQKVAKRKVKRAAPKSFVLVYSLGDEMYKWARPQQLSKFEDQLDEKYHFPPGWGRELKTHRRHLEEASTEPFNGRRALRDALAALEQRREARRRERANVAQQILYRSAHGLSPCDPRPATQPSVTTPPRRSQRESTSIGSGVKRPRADASALPHPLRGTMSVFDNTLEQAEASDRFSTDDRRRALALLELHGSPTEAEVRRARRLVALKVHPDKQPPHLQSWAEDQMRKLNWAYEVLMKKQQPHQVGQLVLGY